MSGFVLLAAVVAVQTAASVATHNDSMIPSDEIRGSISQKDVYRRLLKHKRQDHAAAVQSIIKIDDFVKQYRMIELVLDKLFQVITTDKKFLHRACLESTFPGAEGSSSRHQCKWMAT